MLFRTHTPTAPFDRLVDNMVFYAGYRPEHRWERTLPDGGVYLIIDLGDSPKRIYDNHRLVEIQTCRRTWLSGAHRGYLTIEAAADSSMLVTRFRSGGAYQCFRVPLCELSDRVIDGELLCGPAINHLRDAVIEAPTPEAKFHLVEQFLLTRAGSNVAVPPLIDLALQRLDQRPAGLTINRVQFETGVSRKHLAELFSRWVGLTPKYYQRIMRFQTALAQIERGQPISWPDLAFECGFYDQPHFINEFHHFCGLNPRQYLSERGEYLNFVPIR